MYYPITTTSRVSLGYKRYKPNPPSRHIVCQLSAPDRGPGRPCGGSQRNKSTEVGWQQVEVLANSILTRWKPSCVSQNPQPPLATPRHLDYMSKPLVFCTILTTPFLILTGYMTVFANNQFIFFYLRKIQGQMMEQKIVCTHYLMYSTYDDLNVLQGQKKKQRNEIQQTLSRIKHKKQNRPSCVGQNALASARRTSVRLFFFYVR